MRGDDAVGRAVFEVGTCPVERAIATIGGKWKVSILWHLLEGTARFAELRDLLPGVSHKVLAGQLRELERDGLVARAIHPEVPPRVEYSLTPRGRTVSPVLDTLCDWGESLDEPAG